jgi:hypothetical protein
MNDPITESQGDEIIQLLQSILNAIENIAKDTSSIEFEVKFELHRIREALSGLKR